MEIRGAGRDVRGDRKRSGADVICLGLVVAFAAVFAASRLAAYAADPAELWRGLHEDRNAHFAFGLNLALSLQHLDFVDFLDGVINARLWPPVHGLALAFVMLLGDLDLRLAIVPNLAAWTCTVVLTFLIARRMFDDQLSGNFAGALAAAFAITSPAFQLITADVYLEGLGAALTATCCYAYVRARSSQDTLWWRALAVALTLLFFEKSNYWALTVVPFALAYMSEDIPHWLAIVRAVTRNRFGLLVLRTLRDPLMIIAAILAVVIAVLYARGPTVFWVFGARVSLYPPNNLITAVYIIVALRLFLQWRPRRQDIDASLPVAARQLLYWHLLPVALSFMIPKRLTTLLWYMGPSNATTPDYHPLHALSFQWETFSGGFHVTSWVAILVLVLGAVTALRVSSLPASARGILLVAVVSAVALVFHPNQQGRFQTNWIPTVWIMAGLGGGIVLSWIGARLPIVVRIAAALVVIASFVFAESRYRWTEVAYLTGMALRSGPSDLELAKAFLPSVRGARTVGFIVSFPFERAFFDWTTELDCRCRLRVDSPSLAAWQTREQYRQAAIDWLKQTRAERVVVIDGPIYEYAFLGETYDKLSAQVDAIQDDDRFERISALDVPNFKATVSVWRRKP